MEIYNDVPTFLAFKGKMVDVRSPLEFQKAHIPDALNIPLFSNEERSGVGTIYKQQSRELAIEEGLGLVGPKMKMLAQEAKLTLGNQVGKIYCFRGGLRSRAMAWLFDFIGLSVITLKGGYKEFRRWGMQLFEREWPLICLSGFTGSGKTDILKQMALLGEQIIDLEELANHRGSSYGMIGRVQQPGTEHFENQLACLLNSFDPDKPIWIEDESKLIGTCHIPDSFYKSMQKAYHLFIHRPIKERCSKIYTQYGLYDKEELIRATTRIQKKLGGQRTKEAVRAIEQGQFEQAIYLILAYYDSAYLHMLKKKQPMILEFKKERLKDKEWALYLLEKAAKIM